MFERYVNFEFYKTLGKLSIWITLFERYVNFEFYKTMNALKTSSLGLRDM